MAKARSDDILVVVQIWMQPPVTGWRLNHCTSISLHDVNIENKTSGRADGGSKVLSMWQKTTCLCK